MNNLDGKEIYNILIYKYKNEKGQILVEYSLFLGTDSCFLSVYSFLSCVYVSENDII